MAGDILRGSYRTNSGAYMGSDRIYHRGLFEVSKLPDFKLVLVTGRLPTDTADSQQARSATSIQPWGTNLRKSIPEVLREVLKPLNSEKLVEKVWEFV